MALTLVFAIFFSAKKAIIDMERAKIVIERSQAESQTSDNLRSAVAENENSPAFGRAASGLQGTWMNNRTGRCEQIARSYT